MKILLVEEFIESWSDTIYDLIDDTISDISIFVVCRFGHLI